jgi:hypothetical protein
MAKSRTRKKFVKKALPPKNLSNEIKQVSVQLTNYVKRWTRQELGKLQNEKNPVCIPVNDGYRIGLYHLQVYPNKICEVYDPNGELVQTFENKISAILYTIYTIKRKYRNADEIISINGQINKNYTDVVALRHSIETARRKKDFEYLDIRQSRLEIAEKQLNIAREQILKIHRIAKINKVWE